MVLVFLSVMNYLIDAYVIYAGMSLTVPHVITSLRTDIKIFEQPPYWQPMQFYDLVSALPSLFSPRTCSTPSEFTGHRRFQPS